MRMYHGTRPEHVTAILREGIQPRRPSVYVSPHPLEPRGVYLSPRFGVAAMRGQVVLQVRTKGLTLFPVVPGRTYVSLRAIPPQRIRKIFDRDGTVIWSRK
jgi:RNA:NAD 2'-phosphotransferase (TPT1/KptA family)